MAGFIEGYGRKQAIKKIRDFIKSYTPGSSILMIGGARGVGKTRTVDEALTGKPANCLVYLDGRGRRKLTLLRKPKQVNRHILPVSLRFPIEEIKESLASLEDDKSKETEVPRIAHDKLLDTLLFELTSQLDPRSNQRVYGRTLRHQLGFWAYWFSFNGLHLPKLGKNQTITSILASVLAFIIFFGSVLFFSNLFDSYTSINWSHLVQSSFFVMPISWLLLRHLDWLGFKRFSDRLYNIAHAESIKQTDYGNAIQEKLIANMASKTKLLPIALGSLGLGGGLGIVGIYKTTFQQFFNNPINISIGIAFFLTLLILIIVYLRHLSVGNIESIFSQSKSTWKITLLRRYLFLLHRLGIEPVLVVDELDKLENSLTLEDQTGKRNDIDLFFNTLLPLKHSIGAEFKWILVGGPKLLQKALVASHQFPPPPLSTLFYDIIPLGPIGSSEIKQKIGSNDEKLGEYLLLKTRGFYAKVNKEEFDLLKPNQELLDEASELAKCVEKIDYTENLKSVFYPQNIGELPGVLDWATQWMKMGALNAAYEWLSTNENKIVFKHSSISKIDDLYDSEKLIRAGYYTFSATWKAEKDKD